MTEIGTAKASRPSWPPTPTTSGRCSRAPSSTSASPSTAVAAPASSPRACRTSGAPGRSRPNDALPGLFEYVKQTSPDAKTVGLTGWDIGEPSNSIVKEDVLKKIADAGYEFNDLYELFPPNTTDYAATLTKIQANEPDVLLCGMLRPGPGLLARPVADGRAERADVRLRVHARRVNASNGAYDSVGWTFAYDYFDAGNPISPLAKLFVREFQARVRRDPDFYAANFYENMLVLWEVIRRVLAKGGDINDGAAARRRPPGEPHRRQRVRRRREHGRAPTPSTRRPTR